MTTAVLVIAVVSLALALGALVVGGAARAAFGREEDTFRCKLRVRGRPRRRLVEDRQGWPRRPTRARWVHDVLVVRRGLLVPRTDVLAVRVPEDAVRRLGPGEVGGMGAEPLGLVLRLDDGRVLELAAPSAERTLLVGPFLAAAMRELPDGPAEQRPRQ